MNVKKPSVAASPYTLVRAVAERPYRLWIQYASGKGRVLDLQRLIHLHPHYGKGGWDGWRQVQVTRAGQQLTWTLGSVLTTETLVAEMRRPPAHSTVRTVSFCGSSDFFRPLRNCVPQMARMSSPASLVQKAYGIDLLQLQVISLQYGVPPTLLHRRLMDLTLARQDIYSVSQDDVRDMLHGRLSGVFNLGATPLVAIRQGHLRSVEELLYPLAAAWDTQIE